MNVRTMELAAAVLALACVGCQGPLAKTYQEVDTRDEPDVQEPVEKPQASSVTDDAPAHTAPDWWRDEGTIIDGRYVATVRADGASVSEAREACLARAIEIARDGGGVDLRIEKTLIATPEPGLYRAFMAVSCVQP